jgi:flagellar hook-associated protein 3 FlgL
MMRVSNITVFENVTSNLGRVTDALFKANEVVSTTKRINRLSDDPVGLVSVLDLRSSLAGVDQMGRNIEMGKTWLTAGESALTQVESLLSDAKGLCVQMVSATTGSTERSNAAESADGYLKQLLSLSNTEVGGRYIFSGTATDTVPFSFDNEATPTSVAYAGNDAPFGIKIGKSLNVEVGRDGEATFGSSGSSIFDTLIALRDALQGNDVDGIQQSMDKLDDSMDSIRSLISDTGAKTLRLETKQTILGDLKLSYAERKSSIEDADLAEAITQMQGKELAYQAALASSSKLMSMSLVDYLK